MHRHYSALARAVLVLAALTMLPILTAATAATQPVWDQAPKNIPCDGKESVTFTPNTGQSALARYDDATKTKVTVVVFFDPSRQEIDGKAYRYHYSTTAGPLNYRLNTADVTVWASACPFGQRVEPTPTRVPPTPVPPTWQHDLVVPCGADPELAYNRTFGFGITWVGPLQDKLIFDAWQDSGHVAASGRDIRTTVTTDHAFAGCKLYWTDNAPSRYTVSFFARLPNTGSPAQGE